MKPFTAAELVPAMNEWMRRFVQEPERFAAEIRTVNLFVAEEAAGREPSYGQGCAEYLDRIRRDLSAAAKNQAANLQLEQPGPAPAKKASRRKSARRKRK